MAAEGPQGRGLALGQVEGLPAPGAAPAQARGLEGELRPLPPGRPRRRLVADGKGDPEGAAAEDGLDAVAAVNQVPGAEGVALRFSLFPPSSFAAARRRRRRRSRRRRPQRRLRQRRRRGGGGRSGGDISPRPLEGDGLRSGSAVLLCGSGGVVAVGAAVRSGGRDDGGDSGEGGRGGGRASSTSKPGTTNGARSFRGEEGTPRADCYRRPSGMMLGIRGGTGGGACDYFASKERGEGGGREKAGDEIRMTRSLRPLSECLNAWCFLMSLSNFNAGCCDKIVDPST